MTKITKIKDTNEEYHSRKEISASGIKTIHKKSVYHYLNQKPFSSSSMELGTAVHTMLLEPEKFIEEYFVAPKLDLRTKAGKEQKAEFEKANVGKKMLRDEEWHIVKNIANNFNEHELAKKYCNGMKEMSHYTTYKGVPVRVRPDNINYGLEFISDVKTCQDNSPQAFKRDVYKYAYHVQAAFYSLVLGFPVENFRFIAVETNYPFSVEVYALSDDLIEQGINHMNKALNSWKLYYTSGIITGYEAETKNDGSLIL